MKKRIFATVFFALIVAMSVVAVGCKSPDKEPTETPAVEETVLGKALKNAKTTFVAEGTSNYKIEGSDPELTYLKTVFGDDVVRLTVTDESGEVTVDEVYVNNNGKAGAPYHTVNNEIAYYDASADSYAECDNPFKVLVESDFTAVEGKDNVYELTDETKKRATSFAITGYDESIENFTATVINGNIGKLDIKTQRIKRSYIDYEIDEETGEEIEVKKEFYYVSEYEFTLSQFGTAQVDPILYKPFETKPEHTLLKNALAAASSAKNYTIDVHEEEEGYETLEYHTFVTEEAIYIDLPKWEEGYVQTGNVVRHFSYDSENELVTLDDAVQFPTIRSMRASFNGFAAELFERNEFGVYNLRTDLNIWDEYYYIQAVRDILINFGDGIDWIRLYANYTYDVKLFVKNDALYQVQLVYLVPNMGVTTRTLTYRDFDNTEMPISFDNCDSKSVLDDYIGTYTDGSVTAEISKDGITVNKSVYEVTDYSVLYGTFTGNWNGGVWYIEKFGKNQLLFYNLTDNITYTLTNTEIEPVEIPEAYNGVWKHGDNTLAIAYNKAEYNGQMLKVLSYDEEGEVLYAMRGETSYRLFAGTKNGEPAIGFVSYVDGMSEEYFDMTKVDNAVIIPQVLVGTFEKEYVIQNYKYRAVIGLTSVSLELAGQKPASVTVTSASNDGYAQIVLDVDGVEYTIAIHQYTNEKITLYSPDGGCDEVLDRVEEKEPSLGGCQWANLIGTYMGENEGSEYVVVISSTGVTVTVDGVEKIITSLEYDEVDDFIVTIDDETYYITSYGEDIMLYNDSYSVVVFLSK